MIHLNNPNKLNGKSKTIEDIRNHVRTFLEYDGNLLRRVLISCNNQTLHNPFIESNSYDINNQINAKESFDELPDDTLKKQKSANQPFSNKRFLKITKDLPHMNPIGVRFPGSLRNFGISVKEEATEDALCYELKRNRNKVYR